MTVQVLRIPVDATSWAGHEHVPFFGVEFACVLKLGFDVTYLYDPPLRRSGVHVPEDGVRIEGACRRTTGASSACWRTPGRHSATAGPSTPSSCSATAACIQGVVGIGEPIIGTGKQMVLVHLGAGLFTFGSSLEQIPVDLVRRRVRRWSVIECDFDHFGSGSRRWR